MDCRVKPGNDRHNYSAACAMAMSKSPTGGVRASRGAMMLQPSKRSGVFPISRVVRLPFGCGHFDQSRERCDGPTADISFGAR
jgi:hypothetical protein